MTGKRKLLIAGVAAIVLFGGFTLLRPKTGGTDGAPPEDAMASAAALTVAVVSPEKSTWPVQVQANGWLAPWQEVIISAQVAGQMIVSVNADVGDSVAENDLLAALSSESLENDILQLEASLESARASLDLATSDAERARQLSSGNAISQQQASEYFSTERKAKADVASAGAKLASARLDLTHTQVTAVTGGIISGRSAAVGDVVSQGQELFRLVRDGRVEWQAEVPLTQLRDIKVGTPVNVPTPIGTIPGEVRRVAPTASETNGRVIVYVALNAPDGPDGPVTPKTGIMISGVFETGRRAALSVPASAVVMQDGFSYVYTVEEAETTTVSRVRVDTGRRQEDRVEITSDLPETARVVQSGGAFLTDGAVVRLAPADASVKSDGAKSGAASAATGGMPEDTPENAAGPSQSTATEARQ